MSFSRAQASERGMNEPRVALSRNARLSHCRDEIV
jgi:hypothetical protein